MLAVTLSDFSAGAASSFLASLIILALTHLDDLEFILTSPRRYKYLAGPWHQYHLTKDSRHAPPVFWATHDETLEVTSFGRIRGKSAGRYTPALDYKIKGNIRQHVMRLRLTNLNASEQPVSIAYPRLLSDDIVVGFWVGHNYDERMCAGPIVLSRKPLSADELAAVVASEHLLTVGTDGNPPVVDPAPERGTPLPSRWGNILLGIGNHAKAVALLLVVSVIAVVLIFSLIPAHNDEANPLMLRKAYATRLGTMARSVEDMLRCHEKLYPITSVGGSVPTEQGLASLVSVLTAAQLSTVQAASSELSRLFSPPYFAPRAGTRAAHDAWRDNAVLRSHVLRVSRLLRSALIALGGREPHIDSCARLPKLWQRAVDGRMTEHSGG